MELQESIRQLESDVDLQASFLLMKELRPHLHDLARYVEQIMHQSAQGYRLLAACHNDVIVGLAGYRLQSNLRLGRFIYVDDLIVQASLRRSGVGERLLQAARQQAIAQNCEHFVLDTGLHMALAQRFYFRQGLLAQGLHFVEKLTQESLT
jgi:GNAT superfamily N-acetyltransferase